MKISFKKLNLEYLLLGIILAFGFFLRVWKLGLPSLWIDESTSAIASLNIITKGLPIFDSGLLYSRAYLFHYLQAFFLLFGQTEFLARFVSVIFGLLIIFLAYKIGREYSKSGGLISALFMAVFYLEVFYSRQARFYQLFQLMFFLSLYLLYKSKKNNWCLYGSLIAFFITINTQIAGLVLAPFFIIYIIVYNKKWRRYLAILPGISIIQKFLPAKGLSADSTSSAINYASRYTGYTHNLLYMIILFVPGVIWGFFKKRRLTILMILPSIIMLVGIFTLKTFALRYAYFAVFPLVLYSSLLISFLYEKYGKIMLIVIVGLLVIPSNLFFPYTSVNILKPINYNLYDSSAPTTDYKNVPMELMSELKSNENILISYFSSDVEWNIRKPDYVLPFSMDGRGEDQISRELASGKVVDRYSGAPMLSRDLDGGYYVLADSFSVSKLRPGQRDLLEDLIDGCEVVYSEVDLRIYLCG
tara:strand:+ start:1342 stop:2757 length:1416 start_codon:yes stop_codon:yes gene_type:complete